MPVPEPLLERFVRGRPASFATAGEQPWRQRILADLAGLIPHSQPAFLELDFVVARAIGYAEGADLDNLCEPVFSTLVNRLGWFGGRRPNVMAFRARKVVGQDTGCRVRITKARWSDAWIDGTQLLNASTSIALPRSARDEDFTGWVAERMTGPARPADAVGVEVRFAGPVNLGDIATGRLKNVIDCLHPVIGGTGRAPLDDRIRTLEVWRSDPEVSGTVRVRVVALKP
jgi:hypothetical protein